VLNRLRNLISPAELWQRFRNSRPVNWFVEVLIFGNTSKYAGRSAKISLNSWLVPILVLVILVTDLTINYKGWRILTVGIGGALLISTLWVLTLARSLQLTRERRFGWAQVGDRLLERFTLLNQAWAPALWAEILDQSTLPEYQVSRGVGVSAHDSIRWHTEAVCTRRGLFMLGPTHVQTGDPFGVYTVSIAYRASTPLLVLPPIVSLPSIEVAPGGRTGAGRPVPNAIDRTVSASSVREYMPGDSRRWIHWRISAHRDELFVRMFDGTPAGDWWILLDMDRHAQEGEGANATEEHGIILAASLADRGLRNRRAVGLTALGEQLIWLSPQTGEGQKWEILRTLALLSLGSRPIAELLERMRPTIGQRDSLVIITPSVDTTWVETLIPLIRRGVVPTVLLLDPVSFGGTEDPALIQAMLTSLGVVHYRITRDVLDQPERQTPTQRGGGWEWRLLGTGKAVPVQKTAGRMDKAWKPLV
jgi:uncharacterized protein (DUF58 family)